MYQKEGKEKEKLHRANQNIDWPQINIANFSLLLQTLFPLTISMSISIAVDQRLAKKKKREWKREREREGIKKEKQKRKKKAADYPSKHGNQLKHLKARDSCVIQRIFDRIIQLLRQRKWASAATVAAPPPNRKKKGLVNSRIFPLSLCA